VKTAGFLGVNITFPFKQEVIPLLDALSPKRGKSARSTRSRSRRTAARLDTTPIAAGFG